MSCWRLCCEETADKSHAEDADQDACQKPQEAEQFGDVEVEQLTG